jgi:flavodoxin
MATCLSAELMTAQDGQARDVSAYDLVGIGSGIYFGRHHSSILRLVQSWTQPPRRVFLFSSAGLPFMRFIQHAALRTALKQKGCEIVGEFCCRGWDTVGPLWLFGGINRKHPNQRDLERAGNFAAAIASQHCPPAAPTETPGK